MTKELHDYLIRNKKLIEEENFKELCVQCSGEHRKELYKFLLTCSNNDHTILYKNVFATALQLGIEGLISNVHVCYVGMEQPFRDKNFYVGTFDYLIVANNKMYEGTFDYGVECSELPRGSNILKQCAKEFVEELKTIL